MSENPLRCQAFMDSLYPKDVIFQMERIYGRSWFSPGGEAVVKEFLLKLNLQPGDRVLEIGSGPGGAAVYMAKFYGAHVHGVDICNNMIDVARDRLAKEDKEVMDKVHFELADITKVDYESDSYDVIYSLGTIMFIAEKEHLFKNLYKWLKPGGTILIGDICVGDKEQYSKTFTEMIKKRRYHLRTIRDYSKQIEGVGFKSLVAIDDTNSLIKIMEKDLVCFQATKEDFVKDYSEEDFNSIEKDWKDRLDWCRDSEHLLGVFQAKK